MQIQKTEIPGMLVIDLVRRDDDRGSFTEVYRRDVLAQAGVPLHFIQENESRSHFNVIRGMHGQRGMSKLCRVVSGEVRDVVLDVRLGSPAFGKAVAVNLSADYARQVLVPPGCVHGFQSLTEGAIFVYACDRLYNPAEEYGVSWLDPVFDGLWITNLRPTLSLKDDVLPLLQDIPRGRLPRYEDVSAVPAPTM